LGAEAASFSFVSEADEVGRPSDFSPPPQVFQIPLEEPQSSFDSSNSGSNTLCRNFEYQAHVSGDISSLRYSENGLSFGREPVDLSRDIAEETVDVLLKPFPFVFRERHRTRENRARAGRGL